MDRKRLIDVFFTRYERMFNECLGGDNSHLGTAIESFTHCFIEAGPKGVICAENDGQFLERLKQGFAFYKSLGSTSMHIKGKQIQELNDTYSLAQVDWHYTAVNKQQNHVEISSRIHYVLQTLNEGVKICCYIAGDEQKVLQEKGLI